MSLDNIVNITISTNSLQMAQTGFGVPLIIAHHDLWKERVKTFSYLSDLPKELDTKSKLYLTAKALVSQNPKVPKFKIGKREDRDTTITDTLQATMDADSDFYGVLLASDHKTDGADYIREIGELVAAVSTRRLLAGIDFELGTENVNLDGFKTALAESKRVFAIHKTAPQTGPNALPEDFPAAAWMGKMLSQAPGSASWAFKELEGVSKAQLSTDTITKLEAANINRYINIKDVGVTLDGRVAQGEYIDIIHGIDWLHVRIQERLFRLYMVNPKIPFTLQGVDLVRSEIMAQLKEAVYRGLLAADPEPWVSIPNIEDIDPATRGRRILPDVRFGGRLAGAIHYIEIQGTVTT